MPPKAGWIFFDLDGTLANSRGLLETAYFRFLKSYGRRGSKKEFLKLIGPSMLQIAPILKRLHGLPGTRSALYGRYSQEVRRVYRGASLFPGARQLLERARRLGFRTALVTSATRELARPLLKRTGIERFFEKSVFGNDVRRGKPHPAIYRRALERTGADPGRVLVLEDSENGVRSARAAGLPVIAVTHTEPSKKLREAGATLVSEDLETVLRHLKTWDGENGVFIESRAGRIRLETAARRNAGYGWIFACACPVEDSGVYRARGEWLVYARFVKGLQKGGQPFPSIFAVTGIVTTGRGKAQRILFGKRSQNVSIFKGAWETVPAGGIDGTCLKNGKVDHASKLLEEFEEETGFSRRVVRAVKVLGVIFDPRVHVRDVVSEIRLVPGVFRPRLCAQEHTQLKFLDWKSIKQLARRKEVVPSAMAAITLLKKNKPRKGNR